MAEDINSPQGRAEAVWKQIRATLDIDDWSLVCFSAEFLGYMSQRPEYSWLLPEVRGLLIRVWAAYEQGGVGADVSRRTEADGPRSLLQSIGDQRRDQPTEAPLHLRDDWSPENDARAATDDG